MTWRANGNYYSFNEQAIRCCAPSASGVYGLYNIKYQLLIGDSANIRDALLRHLSDTRFRLRRFKATGFVFEPLPSETRELRAQELIREHRPILQTNSLGLVALWHSWRAPSTVAFHADIATTPPLRASFKPAAVELFRRVPCRRERFGRFAVRFGAILVIVGVVTLAARGKTGDVALELYSSLTNPEFSGTAPAAETEAATASLAVKAANSVTETVSVTGSLETRRPEATVEPAKLELVDNSGEPVNDEPTAGRNQTLLERNPRSEQKPRNLNRHEDGWSVQVMATTDERIAARWLDNLKAKTYDAFLVRAEINGRTWYRI